MTGVAPGFPSASTKSRPSAIGCPSSENAFVVTRRPLTRTGAALPPLTFIGASDIAASPRNVVALRRQSWKSSQDV